MKLLERSRIDKFQVMGEWWINQNKDKRFIGTLSYSPEKITLELIGALDNEGLATDESLPIPTEVYGISVEGEGFKIDILSFTDSTFSAPGIPTVKYEVRSFIVGTFTEEFPELFDSAVYSADYLTSWMVPGVYDQTMDMDRTYQKIKYTLPESISFNVPSIEANIKEFHWGKVNRKDITSYEIGINHTSGYKIIPNKRKDLSWFQQTINSIRACLSVLVDYKTSDEQFILWAFDEKRNRQIKYKYFEKIKEVRGSLKKKIEPLFEYEDLRPNFEGVLNSWFEKKEELNTIISLYLSKFENLYIESKFLNSIQALEIFHRRFHIGEILDQKTYNEAADKIKEFINEQFEGETKTFFLGKFKHGNEYNLGKRLRELINDLSPDSKNYIIGNSKRRTSFLQKIIETRNYLTHYDESEKTTILKDPYDQYFATFRMNILLVFALLKEIGLDENLILSKIQEHRQTKHLIEQAKKVFDENR